MFRNISLTTKTLVISVITGVVVWSILDYINVRITHDLFQKHIFYELNQRALNYRKRFDNQIKKVNHSVRIYVSQVRFLNYVEKMENEKWSFKKNINIRYYRSPPLWFPSSSVVRAFYQNRFALLFDSKKRIREVYIYGFDMPPDSLLKPQELFFKLSHNQTFLTSIDNVPYVVSSESIFDSSDQSRATLMLVSPLDEKFLRIAQGFENNEDIVAILSADGDKVINSNQTDIIPADSKVSNLKDRFMMLGKSFFDYGSSELLLRFVTFISREKYESLSKEIIKRNRRQYAIASMALLISFLIIIYLITRRIQNLKRHVIDFAEDTLVDVQYPSNRGDQLYLLENIFQNLIKDLKNSRHELLLINDNLEGQVKLRTQELEHINKQLSDANDKLTETYNKLKKSQSQLIQSAKLASIGTLASGVAHELNNPLTSVMGYVSLIKGTKYGHSELIEKVEKISQASHRMKSIIDHLRTYARESKKEDWQQFSINQPINQALDFFITQFKLREILVQLSIPEPDSTYKVWGDMNQLESIFQNLLLNSRDAFEEIQDDRKKQISIMINIQTETVEVFYQDNATGMKEEVINNIFDPFFTTKEQGKGTGLGLSIVKNIVDDHKGTIGIESECGKGTEFKLTFPLDKKRINDQQESKSEILTQLPSVERNYKNSKILIIDDEPDVVDILSEYLEGYFDIKIVVEPLKALELIEKESFDMIITDMKMPKISGLEILSSTKKYQPKTPVLVMSGFDKKEKDLQYALSHGANDFISKPFGDLDELVMRIENHLD